MTYEADGTRFMGHRVKHCNDPEDMGMAAASYIHRVYTSTVQKKGSFFLVLSGGKTPEILHRRLASPDFKKRFSWDRVMVFWGDERYVAKDNPESNYGMAKRTLLSNIPIPEKNIFSIPTEAETSIEAADRYEETLKRFFHDEGSLIGSPSMPVFDLILLGLGEDGHTASLFLNGPINLRGTRWVEAVTIPPSYPTRERITLTLPVLNSAAQVVFLVSGDNKKETLLEVLKGAVPGREKFAAQLVQPRTDITWFTDIQVPRSLKQSRMKG